MDASRYQDALRKIPSPGAGCHPALLGAANLGIISGIDPHQIHSDIGRSIPPGKRRISDREIQDAINKALSDHQGGTYTPRPRPKPVIQDGKAALQKIINQGTISDEADLWEASPLRLWESPELDPVVLLENLFDPTAYLFIGERHQAGIIGDTIRTAAAWIIHYRNGGKTAPHIIINPLTGTPTTTKTGDKSTLRGDGNVSAYRYCLIEFDNLDRESQIKFFSAVKLPIRALIDSGNKSIHAWVDVQKLATVTTPEQWQSEIKGRLYDRILTPLGVDSACSNPARLSRLPGYYRTEKGKFQRLLWLSPKGKTIC